MTDLLFSKWLLWNKLLKYTFFPHAFHDVKCELALSAFVIWDGVTQAKGPRGADLPERPPDPRGCGHQLAALPCGPAPAGGGQPAAAHGHPAVQHHAGMCGRPGSQLGTLAVPAPAEQQQMSHGLLFLALCGLSHQNTSRVLNLTDCCGYIK